MILRTTHKSLRVWPKIIGVSEIPSVDRQAFFSLANNTNKNFKQLKISQKRDLPWKLDMIRVNYSPPCLFPFSMAFKNPASDKHDSLG